MARLFHSKPDRSVIPKSYKSLISGFGDQINRKEQLKLKEAFRILLNWIETPPRENSNQLIKKSIDTALIALNEMYLRYPSICSLLLYEGYKSKLINRQSIQKTFDISVLQIMDDLLLIDQMDTKRIQNQSENFMKLMLTSVKDVRAILIKLAERIFIMRNLQDYPAAELLSISNETYFLYVQIAHRLGFHSIKNELEDTAFKCIHPVEYRSIDKKLHSSLAERKQFVDSFLMPVHAALKGLNCAYDIQWRTKSVHSIWLKMQKQNVDFEQVYDIFAIRILLKSKPKAEKADCWHAYSIVTNIYKPNPKRLRDWISKPRESGYESLHITVLGPESKWVEIQIRSTRMDELAEKGMAAHWKYKGIKTDTWVENWLKRIRDLFENPNVKLRDLTADPSAKTAIDEIFVFTPAGDLRKLKRGSTVLDLAFDLHTEVGASCSGAKINGRIVTLKQELQNGDRVEILTSKKQKPKRDWLKFVFTSKAKNKIKRWLSEEENLESEQGKAIIKRKFRNWKIPYNDATINFIINHFKFKNALEFYSKIAKKELEPLRLKELIRSQKENEKQLNKPMRVLKEGKAVNKNELNEIIEVEEDHIRNINMTYAKCCSPIPGDPIFGFITIHRGITVHKQKCPNAVQMRKNYDYRQIHVKWTQNQQNLSFEVNIRITGNDEKGLVNRITEIISNELKLNIQSIQIKSKNVKFEGILNVNIQNTDQLNMLLKKLRQTKGVEKAVRIDQNT